MPDHCRTLALVFAVCVGAVIFSQRVSAHSIPDSTSVISNEDYSAESQDRNLIDKETGYVPPRNVFSVGSSIFDKTHPQVGDLEENRLAFELQKRVSRLVDESQRRRQQDFLEGMPKMFILPGKDSLPKYFRLQPYTWRSRSGNTKGFSSEKRPVNKKYYAEPEGSEFLGGPGK